MHAPMSHENSDVFRKLSVAVAVINPNAVGGSTYSNERNPLPFVVIEILPTCTFPSPWCVGSALSLL